MLGLYYLTFIEHFLRDFILQNLRWFRLLQDLVLPQGKKPFESILSEGEANNKLLPWKQWTVEETGKALGDISFIFLI